MEIEWDIIGLAARFDTRHPKAAFRLREIKSVIPVLIGSGAAIIRIPRDDDDDEKEHDTERYEKRPYAARPGLLRIAT